MVTLAKGFPSINDTRLWYRYPSTYYYYMINIIFSYKSYLYLIFLHYSLYVFISTFFIIYLHFYTTVSISLYLSSSTYWYYRHYSTFFINKITNNTSHTYIYISFKWPLTLKYFYIGHTIQHFLSKHKHQNNLSIPE